MSGQKDDRYIRQTLLPEIGEEGQRKLERSSVLVIGAGGLGGPVLLYLAAAGVGRITVLDCDEVSLSNLNRQILYETRDIGGLKAPLAAEKLRRLNDNIKVDAITERLTEDNAGKLIRGYGAAALCLDNLPARKNANRACTAAKIPFVEAGVSGFFGVMTTVIPGETPCYECIHASSAPSGKTPIPIMGAMAAWVGSAQTLAMIRLLLGLPEPSRGALIYFDGMRTTTSLVPIMRNPSCEVCSGLT